MQVNVLSLGAGVQSTALYLKFHRGEMGAKLDAAIFADTQEEPRAVYEHLEWLKSLGGPPIITGTAGKLGDDLVRGVHCKNGSQFASIPAFTTADNGATVGITRRQCSKEYKTEVIGKVLRREILGLQPGRSPKGIKVNQFIGISLDEAGRAARMQRNVPAPRYINRQFALIEQSQTRADCLTYLADKVPHQTPRSACVFCPYHSDHEWHKQKTGDPAGWARSIEVDHALRAAGSVVNRKIDQTMYLHRSCKPLELVQFDPTPPPVRAVQLTMNFAPECEGMCGV